MENVKIKRGGRSEKHVVASKHRNPGLFIHPLGLSRFPYTERNRTEPPPLQTMSNGLLDLPFASLATPPLVFPPATRHPNWTWERITSRDFSGATFVPWHASTFLLAKCFFCFCFVSVSKQMLRGMMIFSTPQPQSRDLNA